ncbi:F-box protein PP2-B11 [Lolium perenne]|uniref:F-box protein PP2-B11 n=1 Tax=Lolium perenne TaxID=4522 RepID=UPI0021E9F9A9|nr:F-box protein PP2-B11-like [Lolium perenne]
MEIERLPEELLQVVISLTSPQDACRTAAVSRAFRAAADSDVVWSCFLPRDLPRFGRKQLPRSPLSSKKGLFERLAAQPALLPGKLVSMQLDRVTGAKCYTMSARALRVPSWGDTRRSSRWIHIEIDFITGGKRFSEAAQFLGVRRLDISGKIRSKMLSENTAYAAYMVFKLGERLHRLDFPFQEASVSVGGIQQSTRQVCLQACLNEEEDVVAGAPPYHILPSIVGPSTVTPGEDVVLPRRRADGWMEVELGQFYNEECDDREVSISLTEITSNVDKSGLIVRGVELRASTTCE